MDRRKFLKWGSFLTISTAATGLAGCSNSHDDDGDEAGSSRPVQYPQGIASGDPRPDSIVLWTRAIADDPAVVSVRVQLARDESFEQILVDEAVTAEPDWDYTIRHKVIGLEASTHYYYRFVSGNSVSVTGRTRTAPAEDTDLAQLKFAFISCQDWSVNHWAAFDELLTQELDFVVHLGDYVYETVSADFQRGGVESVHAPLVLPDGTRRADGAVYATTLADYRTLYRSYRTDARLQALHARFPVIAIWDDHECSDDCWQDRQTYEVADDETPRTARRRSANQAWFEFMPADVSLDMENPSFDNIRIYRAFRFGTLATLLMTDERLYRADHVIPEQEVGSDIGSRYFVPRQLLSQVEALKMVNAGGQLSPVSLLGDTQRDWWKTQLRASTTAWNLWGNEVSLLRMQFNGTRAVAGLLAQGLASAQPALGPLTSYMADALEQDLANADITGDKPITDYPALSMLLSTQAGIPEGVFASQIKPLLDAQLPPAMLLDNYVLNADQWDGYNAERKDLMAFVRDEGIQNVVALTGDIHAFFAGPVMDDYDAQDPHPVMVDLVTAGVSSNSFFSYFKNVVDSNPTFSAARPLIYTESAGVIHNTFNETLRQFNGDWLRHIDTDAQGFAIVTLTPSQLQCEFHKLKPLDGEQAPALPSVAATTQLTVMAGTPAVTVSG